MHGLRHWFGSCSRRCCCGFFGRLMGVERREPEPGLEPGDDLVAAAAAVEDQVGEEEAEAEAEATTTHHRPTLHILHPENRPPHPAPPIPETAVMDGNRASGPAHLAARQQGTLWVVVVDGTTTITTEINSSSSANDR